MMNCSPLSGSWPLSTAGSAATSTRYGEKYDPMMMHDSKRDVANLLHEEAEIRSIRERLRQRQQQQTQQKQTIKKSRDSWER